MAISLTSLGTLSVLGSNVAVFGSVVPWACHHRMTLDGPAPHGKGWNSFGAGVLCFTSFKATIGFKGFENPTRPQVIVVLVFSPTYFAALRPALSPHQNAYTPLLPISASSLYF